MKKRFKLSSKSNRKSFRRGQAVKGLNLRLRPMRGGTRL